MRFGFNGNSTAGSSKNFLKFTVAFPFHDFYITPSIMAELLNSKLQPCLLDRLTDNEPRNQRESIEDRTFSFDRYRRSVIRDLQMLMNTPRPEFDEDVLEDCSQLASSVLNYGVQNLCGRVSNGLDLNELSRNLRKAISIYEPRINASSLRVEAVIDPWKQTGNELTFKVSGDLWANPLPRELIVLTSLDLETGNITLSEPKGI